MLDFLKKTTEGTNLKRLLIVDFILFVLLAVFVNYYKLFSLLVTCCIIAYTIHRFISNILTSDHHEPRKSSTESQLVEFLFRNEQFYQWFKTKSKNRFIRKPSSELAVSKDDLEHLSNEIEIFVRKFSARFIDIWYTPYVGDNDQFLKESKAQLNLLFNDVFSRVVKVDKMRLFACGMFIINKNFANLAMTHRLNNNWDIPFEQLHPALRNSPTSEQVYIKRFLQLVLRKSAPNLHINQPFIEELFVQMIGKNCIQFIINLLAKPNYIFFLIAMLIDKEKTTELFTPPAESSSSRRDNLNELQVKSEPVMLRDEAPPIASERKKSVFSVQSSIYDTGYRPETFYFQIINLKIVDTETSIETKTGKEFTMYNIQFEYRIRNINAPKTSELNSDCSVKKLQRRYKEFVLLQKSLEENYQTKPFLKHIKCPAKYWNLPIGNMDDELVAKRRKRLDDYLNSLIKIPEISQSKDLMSFLELDSSECFRSNDHILLRTFSVVLDKISPIHLSKKTIDEDVDLAVEFGKLEEKNYEFTNNESYDKFSQKLTRILADIKTTESNSDERKSNRSTWSQKSENTEGSKLHFTKNLLELLNKSLVCSAELNSQPTKCYLNNKNVYKLLEVGVCDYYVERYFYDLFNGVLSVEYIRIYLQLLETILFENTKKSTINFDDKNLNFKAHAYELIHWIVPKFFKYAVQPWRFSMNVNFLLDCLESELLNKHLCYSLLDLILYLVYEEEFKTEL